MCRTLQHDKNHPVGIVELMNNIKENVTLGVSASTNASRRNFILKTVSAHSFTLAEQPSEPADPRETHHDEHDVFLLYMREPAVGKTEVYLQAIASVTR